MAEGSDGGAMETTMDTMDVADFQEDVAKNSTKDDRQLSNMISAHGPR